jgi:hypothetical protein
MMMIILQIACGMADFDHRRGNGSIALLFIGADGAWFSCIPCRLQGLQPTQRDKK